MAFHPSRRHFFQITLGSVAAATLGACKSSGGGAAVALSCTDTSALTPGELQARTALGYVDASTEAGKRCSTCLQYVAAAAPTACGTCKVMKGPINPAGNCKAYVAKPPA